MGTNFQTEGALFYGFAENKETELNLDVDCLITKVLVRAGEQVKQGQLLLEANQAKYELKLNNLEYELKEQAIITQLDKAKINNQIAQLEIRKQKDLADLDSKIRSLEAKIALNEKLFDQIKSVEIPEKNRTNTPAYIELESLRREKENLIAPLNQQISLLKDQLEKVGTPQSLNKQRITREKELVGNERAKLKVYAPSDGLIGNVHCIDGEHVSSFNTLISFYERNPTAVKGFVHEKLILEVKLNDKLKVTSSQHVNHEVVGEVLGLGTRIVEIPERLRKMPELKTYGREVLIKIPSNNPFLQKEKVTLNSISKKKSNFLSSYLK